MTSLASPIRIDLTRPPGGVDPDAPHAWRRSDFLRAAAIAAAAFAFFIFYLNHSRLLVYDIFWEQVQIADHLARGHGFLSPLDPAPTAAPTSWSPPVYPYLLSWIFRAAGIKTQASLVTIMSLNAAWLSLAAAALYLLGARLFSRPVGLLAALGLAAHPMFLRYLGYLWDHYLALSLFLWILLYALHLRDKFRARSDGPPTRGRGRLARATHLALLGVALGVLTLTNVTYLLTYPVIVLLAVGPGAWMRRLAVAAIPLLAWAATLTPWTVRNYRAFGHLFLVRDGANLEVWVGNHELSTGWISKHTMLWVHPYMYKPERQVMLAMGETAYYDLCGHRFRYEFRKDPVAFADRTALRVAYLFLSDPTEKADYPFTPKYRVGPVVVSRFLTNALLALVALAGAYAAWRLGHLPVTWLLPLALLTGLPYLASHVWDRYTMPLRALLLLPAAFLATAVYARLRTGAWPTGHALAPARPGARPPLFLDARNRPAPPAEPPALKPGADEPEETDAPIHATRD